MRVASAVCVLSLVVGARLSAADLDEVKRRGMLRVGSVSLESSPFLYPGEGGAPAGFDRDVLDAFARAHGIRVEFASAARIDDLVPWLLEGKVDVVAGGFTRTEARARQVDFTVEVLPQRHVVLTRKPRRPVLALEELRGMRVGTVRGTSWADAVEQAGVPRANVDDSLTLSPPVVVEALRSGRVAAAVTGVVFATLVVKLDPEVEPGLFLGTPGSNAYAVSKSAPALRQALTEHVESLKRTRSWYELLVRHFGQAAPGILERTRGGP